MPPVAARPAAVGCLGEAFGFPAAFAGGVEVPSGLALGGVGVAAPAGFEVASGPLEAGEADLGGSEFFGPVGWDRGLGRLSLGFEAGEAEGFSDGGGGGLVRSTSRGSVAGVPESMAQRARRSTDQSRVRSSTAWSRSSATTWTVLVSRARLMET